jgi:RNA polymerase sigma-70 factor (ECF subfamily)
MLEDRLLVWKAKSGDADGLRGIYEKYKDDLLSIAFALLHNAADAEDILHEVFVNFAKGINEFELYGSLRKYLIKCMISRIHDRWRSKLYEVRELERGVDLASPQKRPEEEAMEAEEAERMTAALARLPFQQREVVVLHLLGDMKFREIATMQDVSINTAQSRYRYGLEKLKAVLESEFLE